MANSLLIGLSRQFVRRSEALGLKGKKRDEAAMDFFCGAFAALEAMKHGVEASNLATVIALVLSTRGYSEVEKWASIKETKEDVVET